MSFLQKIGATLHKYVFLYTKFEVNYIIIFWAVYIFREHKASFLMDSPCQDVASAYLMVQLLWNILSVPQADCIDENNEETNCDTCIKVGEGEYGMNTKGFQTNGVLRRLLIWNALHLKQRKDHSCLSLVLLDFQLLQYWSLSGINYYRVNFYHNYRIF